MKKRKRSWGKLLGQLALILCAAAALFPVLFMVTHSFFSGSEITESYGALSGSGEMRFHLIPDRATLESWAEVFLLSPSYLMKFWSSMLLALGTVAGQVIVSAVSGYGFAKFKFPMRRVLYFTVVILMMMPVQVLMVSQYPVLQKLGLLGSYWALIIPGAFGAFGIFLITQVYSYIPDELLEAAKIDGASHLQILLRIVVPCSKMGIASLVVLSFIDNWNLVEQPIVFLKNTWQYPLSVFLSQINESRLDVAFVCGVLAILPTALLYLFMKDALVSGIENASLK